MYSPNAKVGPFGGAVMLPVMIGLPFGSMPAPSISMPIRLSRLGGSGVGSPAAGTLRMYAITAIVSSSLKRPANEIRSPAHCEWGPFQRSALTYCRECCRDLEQIQVDFTHSLHA